LLAYGFKAQTNVESVYITALILALIISPASTPAGFIFLGWAGILAMASKYVLALGKKHIFNPAAIAVVITLYVLGQSASWWIGTAVLMPFVAVAGFFIIRKLRFEDLAWAFFSAFLITSLVITITKGGNVFTTLNQLVFHSFLIYLGSIMLTEPLTLPPTKHLQIVYGAIVGVLAVPQFHIGSIYFAPELALCIGNVFAYLVSPETKLVLTLQGKIQTSPDTRDFIFNPQIRFAFAPGQYMEWTLSHPNSDSRGNKRYFTIASSPTEETVRLGVKFYGNGSSYKKALQNLSEQTPVVGAQLAGDFTLPKNQNKKLVFLAGGIGITPFRSMLKYLIDTNQKRDIVLIYSNKIAGEIVYKNIFDEAYKKLGIRTVYTLTDKEHISPGWKGNIGRIDARLIASEISDFEERIFYISGPHVMVTAYDEVLRGMGVKKQNIKKDYFPGLV
jgi:ferredoxin-NADP reductase